MKFLLHQFPLLLIALCFSKTIQSQSTVKGKITDSKESPIAFVTVALLSASDSAIVKGTASDENGEFLLGELSAGNYFIRLSSLEFKTRDAPVFFLDSNTIYTHMPLKMTGSQNTLEEISVTAMKKTFEFKNGNITVNVAGSALAIGNTVYDLLSRLPGVMIDNGNITILGKQGVSVYIDDRIQQLSGNQLVSLLKSMNASSVENIEIIKNPSAKYDAAGSAGIIHIKTKKIKITGFSGSVGYTWSQGYGAQHMPDLSLNYKGKKFAVFNSLNLYSGYLKSTTDLNKSVSYMGSSTVLDSKSFESDDGKFGIGNFAIDWYPNSKNTLGIKYQSVFGKVMRINSGNNSLSDNSEGYQNLVYKRTVPNNFYNANYNLNYEHLFDTLGTKIKSSTDFYSPNYDIFKSDYRYRFEDANDSEVRTAAQYKAYNRLDLFILSSRVDVEKKIAGFCQLESGIKASYLDIGSNYDFQVEDPQNGSFTTDSAFSNQFHYREQISAAYVNLQKEIKKISLQLGLRAEDTKLNTVSELKAYQLSRHYFKLFPSMNVNYNPSERHTYALSYNRRIYRPDYNSFNPYLVFNNLYSISTGNPYLLPSFTHNIEVSHTYKAKITNSFSYFREQNPIRPQTLQIDSSKVTIFRNGNLTSSNEMNYYVFVNTEIKKWWSLTLNLGAYYFDFKGTVDGGLLNTVGYSYSAYTNNQFMLPKNFKLELSGWFVGPWLWGGLYRIQPRGAFNVAIKKTFFSEQLSLSAALYDVLFTGINQTAIDFQNQHLRMRETYDSRRFNLSLVYNFGKLKINQRDVKSDEDAKSRLKH